MTHTYSISLIINSITLLSSSWSLFYLYSLHENETSCWFYPSITLIISLYSFDCSFPTQCLFHLDLTQVKDFHAFSPLQPRLASSISTIAECITNQTWKRSESKWIEAQFAMRKASPDLASLRFTYQWSESKSTSLGIFLASPIRFAIS